MAALDPSFVLSTQANEDELKHLIDFVEGIDFTMVDSRNNFRYANTWRSADGDFV